ncbi:MAG: phage Gp37/Gp68 family protein [Polyangiaceae bacterium]
MGANTKIEWANDTFNTHWGCTEVSPACDNCYAKKLAKRYGFDVWGPNAPTRRLGEGHWREPLRWNALAARAGERRRVFCSSMADIFQGRADHAPLLARLWPLIEQTPNLDWLLLTKRPTKVAQLVPWSSAWAPNVWIGTTVENQEWAEKRIPYLLALPAVVRFVSAEPLLGPIDLQPYLDGARRIDWVIAGGESGPAARPMEVAWVRELRDQCVTAGVPFHFKQWGTFGPREGFERLVRLGKKNAGRAIDGRTWDELPEPARVSHVSGAAVQEVKHG